ncbi:MAG TPA: tagatose 1,6-diphosphate aldolase [Acidimicrobiales bacterium]|nr:tagatose 1,6-diphosphate aldolase [Acidimicrobiales bacterium]MDP7351886.1 tagatose 1,6-diphosphate aldolase [Acidimicrobiales bacterium]HJL88817.1 tagatose 1,6-diphosphate aldolase [Acidimicrobiales bacterium]HJM32789.1 tagatose 1,6-diphosphate aldolase [Acidimicrobiales bacterium]
MELSAGKLWGLRRLADAEGRFKMTAVDQRPPIEGLICERRGIEAAPYEEVCAVKALLAEELADGSSALLVDPYYAYPVAAPVLPPEKGLILTLEDSAFEESPGGRRSAEIGDWGVEKIKRTGADAVKVLAWYRPDADPAVVEHQQAFVARTGEACRRLDLPFVFELLVYPLAGDDYAEDPIRRSEHVLASVEAFADPRFGVDLFKLESPVATGDMPDPDADEGSVAGLFTEMGRLAGRPWVMLSAGVQRDAFERILTFAYRAGASGYLAGRSIWWDAFCRYPDLEAMRAELRADGVPYMVEINQMTDESATPWHDHPAFGPEGPTLAGTGGPGFPAGYNDLEGER